MPITGTPAQPVLEGPGPPLEVAVQMRAFDNAALWDRLAAAGQLDAAQVDQLAATVARFHDGAAVADFASIRSVDLAVFPGGRGARSLRARGAAHGGRAALRGPASRRR